MSKAAQTPEQSGDDGRSMLLTCYADTHGYRWHHVDLFVHDSRGRELDWVHWQVEKDGPAGADAATAKVEPTLRRTAAWQHGVSADGSEYWTAPAVWGQ
ncbi:hypothetical protein ACIPW9_18135 [Streptomyces sp. NPDC090052]|uniref:hypothetical protein n=1 Tax=unclassified Streptomyces TaxID=2593676 RepID=UPI002250F6BB|nr:hypothetical protein [Streptomyces sp. NBC_01306]MCX4728100.1 hypothetical protein [Streptomyces sp. NBC_01306]WSX40744.1 hypothetical protein OG760_02975 [Streptomyces sp. NBC_00963]